MKTSVATFEKTTYFFKLCAIKYNLPVRKISKQFGTHEGQKRDVNLHRLKEWVLGVMEMIRKKSHSD